MPKPSFRVTNTESLRVVQEDVREFAEKLSSHTGARFLKSLALTTTQQSFAHKLGGTPDGVIICVPNAQVTIWQSQAADDRFIYLTASAACTVTVMVF